MLGIQGVTRVEQVRSEHLVSLQSRVPGLQMLANLHSKGLRLSENKAAVRPAVVTLIATEQAIQEETGPPLNLDPLDRPLRAEVINFRYFYAFAPSV